ncbi:hypothetical protein [Rhodosalinus sp. 5P4]|uniref:hypothetical protein n=1 Tax=Rhodosalinus sp. 5P4 TaxID=3239196 RepID=UPI0035257392
MTGLLARAGRQGRWLLLAGLAAGIALPDLAGAMIPAIVPLIAATLFVAALRTGPAAALPPRAGLRRAVLRTLVLQTALPLAAGAALAALGWLDRPAAIGAVLVLAAAPITGVPGLAVMSGADPAAALRQLALGTALLPFTAAPVFALLPVFPDPLAVAAGALRLLAVIGAAVGAAALARRLIPALTRPEAIPALDGAMAIAMAVVVIALMSAVGPAILSATAALAGNLALAFALNLGLARGVFVLGGAALPRGEAAALAIAAACRNLALFLAALPPETTGQILLFVGCYQVPMYLTPLVLPRLLGRR